MEEPNQNNRVTNAQLYKALFDLDQGLSDRFTALDRQFAAVHDRIGNVEDRQELHEKRNHANVATGKVSGIVGVAVAIATAVAVTIKQIFAS